MVATFITTYKRTKLHERKKEKKEEKKRKRKGKRKKEVKGNKINTRKKIILMSHKMKTHLDSTPKI